MRKEFIRGNTVEEKISSIERVLQRFSRRIHRTVSVVTPPSVISNFVAELPSDKVIFRCIMPCDGVIDCVRLHNTAEESEDGTRPVVEIYVENEGKLNVSVYPVNNLETGISVKAGDRITITFKGRGANFWTSLLFISSTAKSGRETIAIEQIEKNIEALRGE